MTQWGLDTLFNPAKRHMDEEKRRLQSTREEIGDSSGGNRIDFESGKVTIRRKTPKQADGTDEPTDSPTDAEGSEGSDAAEGTEDDAQPSGEATGEATDDGEASARGVAAEGSSDGSAG